MSSVDLQLYYAPRTRSFSALWFLEELGQPYELKSFAISSGEHKQQRYLELNPMGKVPTVIHHGVPISETGAIALLLADRFPASGLAPGIDNPDRAAYLRWLFFSGSVMEPALGEKFFNWDIPASSVAWGSFADMQKVLTDCISTQSYLLGANFTAADIVVGSTARFGVLFGAFSKDSSVSRYVEGLTQRPAYQRAMKIEERESERFPAPESKT